MSNFASEYRTYCERHGVPERIELMLCDLNGILRGKWLPGSSIDKLINGEVRLPQSTCAPNILGEEVKASGLGIVIGDPDGVLVPVAGTLKPICWSEGNHAQVLVQMSGLDGAQLGLNPREILQNVLLRFLDKGLQPVIATELEFYMFERRDKNDLPPQKPNYSPGTQNYDLETMADYQHVLDEIIEASKRQELPTDTLIAEYGAGQYEINFHHTSDVLFAADIAVEFKRIVRAIARKHGLDASFMAKPYRDMPGNGMHVHASLLNAQGQNIFSGHKNQPNDDQPHERLKQAVAGLLTTMADMQAVFAPHANSYRRFQMGSFAPSSPSWAIDNRAVGVRLPEISGKGARLEHRICGADVNPYLAVAAILGGMLKGLEAKPSLPPALNIGDEDKAPKLCSDWQTALNNFAKSEFAEALFGRHYCDLFVAVKQDEIAQLTSIIHPMEYQYYLSRF